MKKTISVYKNMSPPVKASLWFMVCNILQKGIAFLTTPIFTRLLTPEQYGVYSVYQSWYLIIGIFATLNLSAGVYNNGLTKFSKDKDSLTSSFLGLSNCVTIGAFIIYITNTNFWNHIFDLSTVFICAMFIQLLFEPAYNLWCVRQRYEYKYVKQIFATVYITLGTPIVGVIAVLNTDYKVEARVISGVLIQVCIGIIAYILIMSRGKLIFNKQYWLFALSFNLPLIPHYLSTTILNQADRIMIRMMVGESQAGIYSIAYSISMMMNIITNGINGSFVPYTYRALKSKNYESIGKNANFLLMLMGVMCVCTMAFGPELIRIVATPEYLDAKWIVPPVAASVFFLFLYSLFGNIEFYFERTKFIMAASCTGALLNILLNYIFIKLYGYYAAGYTTLVCYILFAVAHYIVYKKILRHEISEIKDIYNTKVIITISIGVILCMIIMIILYNYTVLRYLILVIIGIFLLFKKNDILAKFREIKGS